MKVLLITQKLDPLDQVLSFTVDWVRALAQRVDHLHVLALEKRPTPNLPANVTVWSMGKELGYGRLRELGQFYRVLIGVIAKVDVVFVHMIPRYALLALPVARPARVPVGLWYTHSAASLELRQAARYVDWIVTASENSFPIRSSKVHVLNHGINPQKFKPGIGAKLSPPMIISVGRLAPIKHHETLLEAAALLRAVHGNPPCQFVVVGAEVSSSPPGYRESLLARRDCLKLSPDQFQFPGLVQSDDLVRLYQQATLSVNLMPTGALDKAGLEAMLCGLILIAVNKDFASIWGEYAPQLQLPDSTNAAELAQRIAAALAMPEQERNRVGNDLRERVQAVHSLDRLMDRLVALMA